MDQNELDKLSRNELIERARRLGVERAELMTRVELRDEIVRLSETDVVRKKRARGWLGVARDLLASVVDRGLHLPEAAALIRGDIGIDLAAKPHRPVATVTLAEIYAAQGHVTRAVELLDEVLAREPDHEAACGLSERLKPELERRRAAAALRAEQRKSAEPAEPETAPAEPEPEQIDHGWEPMPATPEASPEIAVEAAPEPATSEASPEIAVEAAPEPVTPEASPEIAVEAAPAPAAGSDLLVAIPRGRSGTFVYWELGPESIERARRRFPDGRATVRVVALEPCWDGAKQSECEIDADPPTGSVLLEDFPETSVVRAVLGWRSLAGFRPLEVGLVARLPEGNPRDEASLKVEWSPPGRADRATPFELARGRLLDRLQAR